MISRIILFFTKKSTLISNGTFLLILLAGLPYSYYLGNDLRFPDEANYYSLATNLANGSGYSFDGMTPSAWRTPGYPIFLALFIKLGATIPLLRFLNFIALASCVFIIRSFLKQHATEAGAAFSGLLLLGYPVLFYTAGTLYPQTLFTLLLLLLFQLITSADFTWLRAALFGLCAAAIIMLHPTAIFLPPLMYLWKIYPHNYKYILKGCLSLFAILVCFFPWTYRNYHVFHAFVPLSLHGGDTLYWGNNPATDIDAWYRSVTSDVEKQTLGLTEVEEDRYYKQLALNFIKEQPLSAIKLYLLKLLHHFNFRNQFYVQSEWSMGKSVIMFCTYYPLLLCLIIRLLSHGYLPLSRTEILLVAIYLGSALFHAIFLTRIRFRLPYDVLLITHIGIMFSLLAERWNQRPEVTTHT